ncbi:MAG: zinc-ribbon domain-containing protein [Clostridia bacterium]|nr:zinc-ribbon domain-containing protein [Clostridia bacterium]
MEDKTLSCKDCNTTFTFTVGEQQFYAEKGFTNEPLRCPDCRKARKANSSKFSNNFGNNFGNSRPSSRW